MSSTDIIITRGDLDTIFRSFEGFEFEIAESAKGSVIVSLRLVGVPHTTFDINKLLRMGVDTLVLEFTIDKDFINIFVQFILLLCAVSKMMAGFKIHEPYDLKIEYKED